MKNFKGVYHKETGVLRSVDLMVLDRSDTDVYSIDLSLLSKEEKEILDNIITQFENELKPFVKKAFRRFKKDKLEEITDGE